MRKVADYLREEREKKGISLLEVEQATKIKKEYILAIEAGRLHKLPSQAYALGFVKTYGTYLGLPEQKVVAFFRRDYEEEHFEVVPHFRKNQHRFNKHFFFSGKGIISMFAFLIILGYIIFQYAPLLTGPGLTVESPKNGSVIRENVVEVWGKTDPYATVVIDQDEAYVDLNGNYKKTVYTFTGEKTIIVVARNRFGKETRKTVTIKVE